MRMQSDVSDKATTVPLTKTTDFTGIKLVTHHEYFEQDPTVRNWLRAKIKNPKVRIKNYFISLVPFITWIYRYNLTWFTDDLIAGLTVGMIVVPQSIALASLAKLPPQFGLYSAFAGGIIYWPFATSKDISIGPVAVISAATGHVVEAVHRDYPHYEYHVLSSSLAVISGLIVLVMGLFRLGFVLEFIPLPALESFVTGSAITIIIGQLPVLMGNTKWVNKGEAPYKVLFNFCKNIHHCNWNAAIGLTSLFLLYFIRFVCNRATKRYPKMEKIFFFVNTLRTILVIALFFIVSWLVNRNNVAHPYTNFLGEIPHGFQNIAIPVIDRSVLFAFASHLPSTVILLSIKHIAIAKSFGRVNNYAIQPNQEMIAVGITNVAGAYLGAHSTSCSFSRTAIKSKVGVRTPLASLITGCVVALAIYAPPVTFYWISQANLAAVVILAVGDLIIGPDTLKHFWEVSPIEFFIFLLGVVVTLFTTIEHGLYVTILISGAVLLYRIAKARGQFIGRVEIHQMNVSNENEIQSVTKNIYVPLDGSDGTNPSVIPIAPNNGIYIFRLNENFLYLNATCYMERMAKRILHETKRGKSNLYNSLGDQPWNLTTSRHPFKENVKEDSRPRLHAVILDFTGVSYVDITGIQCLVDARRQLDKYAGQTVNWHFAGLANPWIKRALVSVGFGSSENAHLVFSVANVGANLEVEDDDTHANNHPTLVPVLASNRPRFHADLDEAYAAAVADLESSRLTSIPNNEDD